MKEPRELMREPLREAADLERPSAPAYGQYATYSTGRTTEGLQILDYWRAIRKRLWLVAGIAVLITTLTAIYMARKPNVYQASATIQVDLEQTNPDLNVSDRQRPMANPDPSYFNTQLQLLGSDTLLRRVIKEHNFDTNKEFLAAKDEASTSAWRGMLRAIGLASDDAKKKE